LAVIRHLVEFMNRVKRKAQLLVAYYIDEFMKNGRNPENLIQILSSGSDAKNNLGITFWNGVVSSIVIQHKTGGLSIRYSQ